MRILHLEDDPADFELIRAVLDEEGFACDIVRVGTAEEFLAAVKDGGIDLIFSDYSLPGYDGLSALKKAREVCPDIPFIFITGKMGEETAIDVLKNGATDYVLKDKLSRLAPAVHRALMEVREKSERRKAEEKLRNSREDLRRLSAHLQSVREEERTRIAREIHDELGQALTALKLDMSWVMKNLPKDQKEIFEKTRDMSSFVEETIQTTKRICTELRPSMLDHLGIAAAIEWQMGEVQRRSRLEYKISFDPEEITLKQKLATVIFRAFQEALTNIVRHAEATRIEVALRKDADTVTLIVSDNGKGITEDQMARPGSFGLLGIQERAGSFGGDVKVEGVKGKGTTLTLRIPLTHSGKKG